MLQPVVPDAIPSIDRWPNSATLLAVVSRATAATVTARAHAACCACSRLLLSVWSCLSREHEHRDSSSSGYRDSRQRGLRSRTGTAV